MIEISAGILPWAAVVLAAILALLGVLFIASPNKAFSLSGHEQAALPAIMGGRYLGLAALILGLLVLRDNLALALAFSIGAAFGFFDAWATAKVGGKLAPHLGAGLVSAALAVGFFLQTPSV